MKTLVLALIVSGMALSFGACSDVSRTETTKTNWDGSTTHQDTTVKQSPSGAVSVDKTTSTTR